MTGCKLGLLLNFQSNVFKMESRELSIIYN
ncbi:hypothetical protein [Chryseobacterium gallinarum]